jgi:hypothetical protein
VETFCTSSEMIAFSDTSINVTGIGCTRVHSIIVFLQCGISRAPSTCLEEATLFMHSSGRPWSTVQCLLKNRNIELASGSDAGGRLFLVTWPERITDGPPRSETWLDRQVGTTPVTCRTSSAGARLVVLTAMRGQSAIHLAFSVHRVLS